MIGVNNFCEWKGFYEEKLSTLQLKGFWGFKNFPISTSWSSMGCTYWFLERRGLMKVRVIRVHGRRALGLGRLLLGLAPLDDLVTSLDKQAKKLGILTDEKSILFERLMGKSGAVAEGVREATGQDVSKTEVFLYHMPEYEIEFTQAVTAYTKISLDVHGQNKRCRALFVRKAMWKCAGEFKLKEEADRKASMFAM